MSNDCVSARLATPAHNHGARIYRHRHIRLDRQKTRCAQLGVRVRWILLAVAEAEADVMRSPGVHDGIAKIVDWIGAAPAPAMTKVNSQA